MTRWPKGFRPFVLAAVGLALLSSWMAQPASAEDQQADGIFGHVTHESLTGSITLVSDEGTKAPYLFAQEEGRYRVGRFQLAVRIVGSAEKAEASPDLAKPETLTTIEGYVLGSYRVVGPVALAGVYGITRPTIGVPGPVRETWMAGALLGNRARWVLVGAGVRRVVGDDVAAMAAWRLNLAGKTSAIGDAVGVVHGGRLMYQLRAGVAITLAGEP